MKLTLRGLFPYLFLLLFVAALFFALQLGSLPPADFTFSNGTEPQSVDPAQAKGAPEGRIINAIFEGLYRSMPDPEDPTQMVPVPALAASHDISDDLRTYTFHIRPGVKWTNGEPVTSHDWIFSWQRFLHPETAATYSYQLWYIENAARYTSSQVREGDRIEVELTDRPRRGQLFPRGTIVSGKLTKIETYTAAGKLIEPLSDVEEESGHGEEGEASPTYRLFFVDTVPETDGTVQWDASPTPRVFYAQGTPTNIVAKHKGAEAALHVLLHFSEVGIRAPDPQTLEIELEHPTPYFLELAAFYPMYPVNRTCIETHGFPEWTKPENIVTCGPYEIDLWRIRDRIRLVKSPTYWDIRNVKLNVIDALAVQADTTQLNMYMSGQMQWATVVPTSVIPELQERDRQKKKQPGRENERNDLLIAPMATTYFYRVNTTRPPLDNPKVRQALNLVINKQVIVDYVTRAGQIPATGLVPPGIPDYERAESPGYNPERARELLAEAGFPDGRGMRPIQILYNTSEGHKAIAEVIQQQWKKNLQINVELRNVEWGVYLTTVRDMDYDIARAGWIADYPDPNTFLDMFVTNGENNETGWSHAHYDQLLLDARSESDPQRRMEILHAAEEIFVTEMPVLPIYFYVSSNMVRPYVKNFYPNLQDEHPLHILEIDEALREKIHEMEGLK